MSIAVTRIVLWWLMLLLALGVAGYASMALWHPDGIDFVARRSGWLRLALIVHGLSSALALLLGPFHFLAGWRRRWPRAHRWSGRVYLACILISGLTGLWLAFHRPGGVAAQSGFFVLAALWLLTGSLALVAVPGRDFTGHRAWMMRSYALTFGAVTLRIYLGLGVPLAGLPFNEVYAMAAWASWVINLLVFEWLLLQRHSTDALAHWRTTTDHQPPTNHRPAWATDRRAPALGPLVDFHVVKK